MPPKDFFHYPFTAIVNQELMKMALLINAVNPNVGGVLIRGTSGTAKSTAVRALAELLPEIEAVADCPFNCHPRLEAARCPACRERVGNNETLPVASRKRSLVNLPLNATEDRVAGTLDLTRALKEGVKALEPGLLAEANRGILYIDEINLLDDQIIDILLDAAALGINTVEREGVSVSHPASFILVGTMNPEEGELRPQIADRIGLQIEVKGLETVEERVEIMERYERFLNDRYAFIKSYAEEQRRLQDKIGTAERLLPEVRFPGPFYQAVARLTARFEVPSHRADLTIVQCARTLAALDEREEVRLSDLHEAAYLALGHRVPTDPFSAGPALEKRDIERALEKIFTEEWPEKKTPPN